MRHTARLRNRIEAYLTGSPVPPIPPGIPGSGRRHRSLVGGIATDPRWRVGSGMVNTAIRSARPAGREDAWAAGVFRGCMCIRSWPTPGDRRQLPPANKPAIVGLAKLTDASEVLVLQVAAEADNPTHLDLSLDQQRAKRSLRLSGPRTGCGRSPGCSTRLDGAILARNPGIVHPPPDTHDTTTPTQRRADALTDMSRRPRRLTHPAGCPRCPSSWI